MTLKRKETVFLIKFFAIYLVVQYLILIAPLAFLQEAIASFESSLLGLQSVGSQVYANGVFVISASCTGLVSASILAAVVFSLKKPELKKKVAVFVAGAIALLLLNLARVYFVLVVALNWGVEAAETAHTVSWFSTAALILIVWYFATKRIANAKNFADLI